MPGAEHQGYPDCGPLPATAASPDVTTTVTTATEITTDVTEITTDVTTIDVTTIDAVDSERLARFWSSALQLIECEREDDGRWIVLGSETGTLVVRRLGIQRIVGLRRSPSLLSGPKKSRIHVDLRCHPDKFASEVRRLCALGATQVGPPRTESYGQIANLADPEGNIFDLCAYKSVQSTCELG